MCVYCTKSIYVVRDVWNDILLQVYFHNQKDKRFNKIVCIDEIEHIGSQYSITLEYPFLEFNRKNIFQVMQLENKRCKEYGMGIRLELLR